MMRKFGTALVALWVVALLSSSGGLFAQSGDCEFVRGDINNLNGEFVVDLNDGVEILAYLYLGVSAPVCVDAADLNDNGIVEPSDYTYLVNYLFNDGPQPPAPFPNPGVDPTPGITVPEERDPRFSYSIGRAGGVPSTTGYPLELRMTNEVGISGLQVVMQYNQRNDCADILIQEMRVEENTILSGESAEYIIAEWDNVEGIAFIGALKDFATPFHFQSGESGDIAPGEDRLLATLVVGIGACADQGYTPIEFVDGVKIPNDNVTPEVALPDAYNLIVLDDTVVRPTLGEPGGIDVVRGFIRGDANKDDAVDIADPVFLVSHIFLGGTAPPCSDAADSNNDTKIDISDPIFLLNYLFTGGPQPSEPFPQAGVDPSDDGSGSLGCESDG
ncbi:MAG: hypothetical protein AAF488_18510 [Planctomycetota bacterium]